jgi:hypothetical protein
MPEYPHVLPHLYLRGVGAAEPYTTKRRGGRGKLPQRDRAGHAAALRQAITGAREAAAFRRQQRDPNIAAGIPGFYLDFEIPSGSEDAAELLENRVKHIELVTVRQASGESPALATVFVPDSAVDYFLKKVDAYRSEQTKKGRPKNESLIARIQNIALAAVQSLFTDDPAMLPGAGEQIWWEIWIRQGRADTFDTVARRLNVPVQQNRLEFPEREVRLVYGDEITIARLFVNSDAIAEIRRAKDTPSLFVRWSNGEQAAWATDLVGRLNGPGTSAVVLCILDTGVTQAHPLLAPALDPADVHVYDPGWPGGDTRGHGTNMAGTALYGDLMPLLAGNGTVSLTHRLESVKILPDVGENEPRLYGAITRDSIARVEVQEPDRRRAFCIAVTSDFENDRGRPSSWSAAIDQLSFGEGATPRLVLISAGNIREGLSKANYPARNETEPIENPAQAWNVITVGACTYKAILADPTYAGWEPVSPVGDLSPTSRTSLMWDKKWPSKPDVVLEGGNWAALGDQCDCPDDLGLLTTYHDPTTRHFDIFRDTSAATAMAGNLAGKIIGSAPDRWPETVRALIIHSAEWTPTMREQLGAKPSEHQKRAVLRKYGYGVPSYERAAFSSLNDLTLIAEDTLQPFWKDEDDGKVKSRHMNLHQLPWPRTELEQLAETEVELRVTLSYFVEPNPGERGWLRRHRYPSHGLRFAVKRSLESIDAFRKRINAAVAAEEEGIGTIDAGPDNWLLGRIRDAGSVHSDYWRGTAMDLAQRSAIGVYPIGGWWKENPTHERYERLVRYSLIVSIRAVNGTVDIYTPVSIQIATPIQIPT